MTQKYLALIVIGVALSGVLYLACRSPELPQQLPTQCQEIDRLTELAQRGYWYDPHTGLDIMRQLTKLQSELPDPDVCNKL